MPITNSSNDLMKAKDNISGLTCPYPGSLPHGNWTCETQEIPIQGTSFLDEDAQSYPGEYWPLFPVSSEHLPHTFAHWPIQWCIQSGTGMQTWKSQLYSQLFNADSNVNLAMLPRGRHLSHAWMGNMHKGVIICILLNGRISYLKYGGRFESFSKSVKG